MNTKTLDSDSIVHSQTIQRMLQQLTEHARQDIDKVEDPRFQALLCRGAHRAAHRFSSLRQTRREGLESLKGAAEDHAPHWEERPTAVTH